MPDVDVEAAGGGGTAPPAVERPTRAKRVTVEVTTIEEDALPLIEAGSALEPTTPTRRNRASGASGGGDRSNRSSRAGRLLELADIMNSEDFRMRRLSHESKGSSPPTSPDRRSPRGSDFSALSALADASDFHIRWSELVTRRQLGEGAYAVVELCELPPKPERPTLLAVKRLRKYRLVGSAGARVRMEDFESVSFRSEAALLRTLEHPNLVRGYGCLQYVDEDGDEGWATLLEYAAGGTLVERVRAGDYGAADSLRWLLEVARGMAYLHRAEGLGVAHRDLKTENVLLFDGEELGDSTASSASTPRRGGLGSRGGSARRRRPRVAAAPAIAPGAKAAGGKRAGGAAGLRRRSAQALRDSLGPRPPPPTKYAAHVAKIADLGMFRIGGPKLEQQAAAAQAAAAHAAAAQAHAVALAVASAGVGAAHAAAADARGAGGADDGRPNADAAPQDADAVTPFRAHRRSSGRARAESAGRQPRGSDSAAEAESAREGGGPASGSGGGGSAPRPGAWAAGGAGGAGGAAAAPSAADDTAAAGAAGSVGAPPALGATAADAAAEDDSPSDHSAWSMTGRVGSSRYMAPENWLALPNYDGKVDVFSFGVLAYEVLGARRAYAEWRVSPETIARRVATEGIRPHVPAQWPPALVELLSACWATEPERRPTFDEIVRTLEALGVPDDPPAQLLWALERARRAHRQERAREKRRAQLRAMTPGPITRSQMCAIS